MLDENQVIELLCNHLEHNGYAILRRLNTTQKGIDVIAQNDNGDVLLIEAKGGTSSLPKSERHGKSFTANQVLNRVSKGVYTAIKTAASAQTKETSCLAFPDSAIFRQYLDPIYQPLRQLNITIFMVSEDGVRKYNT